MLVFRCCCVPLDVLSSRHWTIQFPSIRPSIHPSIYPVCFLHVYLSSYKCYTRHTHCFSDYPLRNRLAPLHSPTFSHSSGTPFTFSSHAYCSSVRLFVYFHPCNSARSNVISLLSTVKTTTDDAMHVSVFVVGVKKAHHHRHAYPQLLENKWT